jgi:hypothetical protein
MLEEENENLTWLNSFYQVGKNSGCPAWLRQKIAAGAVKVINTQWPQYRKILRNPAKFRKKTLNIIALGDVGGTLMTGLRLLGGEIISAVGMYDKNPLLAKRWEYELNQIHAPGKEMPPFSIIKAADIFACDMLVFCASAGVPPLNSGGDVRLAQFAGNRSIIEEYALKARACRFEGIFAVVSDPVELLCQAAFVASNQDEKGVMDYKGLRPEQIKGYGLGVMSGRGVYYSQKSHKQAMAVFAGEGRTFGAHGKGLILANSIEHYDDNISRKLTRLAQNANLKVRETGFKPYIAPALSSGALAIIATLKGEWHLSANFLGGFYFGAANRDALNGLENEALFLPEKLCQRLEEAYQIIVRQWEEAVYSPLEQGKL